MTNRPETTLRSVLISLAAVCSLFPACAHSARNSRSLGSNGLDGASEVRIAAGVHRASLTVRGTEREFSYFVPSGSSTEKRPVVLYLHGHGDNMRHILGEGLMSSVSSKWMDVAEKENFLVLYPLGLKAKGRRTKTGWNDCRADVEGNPASDDVEFVRQLIRFAAERLDGNSKRVYVTGMSNGGHMTMRVAMEIPEAVAAVAPIVALLPKNNSCSPPSIPVPILMMHGTEDPLAPFEGGKMAGDRGEVMSAVETRETWVRWNGLAEVQEERFELPDTDPSDGSKVRGSKRELKEGGNAVVAYVMEGAGHTQPSREAKLGRLLRRIQGKQNHDVEMAELLWDFFKTRSR